MDRIANLMSEYFDSQAENKAQSVFGLITEGPQSLPIKPSKFVWNVLKEPERFSRSFEFDDRARLIDFVDEILEFEDKLGHHAKITINHKTVDIEVNTKTVESITDLDQEYVKMIDEIFHDVEHYRYEK